MEASDLLFEVFLLLPGPHFSNTSGCVGTVTVNGKAHCPTWVHDSTKTEAGNIGEAGGRERDWL